MHRDRSRRGSCDRRARSASCPARRARGAAGGRRSADRGAPPTASRARRRARRGRPPATRTPCSSERQDTPMKLGVLPRFTRDVIVDPGWVTGFGALCEEMGVESVWGVEHVLVAQDYEPRYPYSADGRMPGNPETVMPDPLEWLAFFAASSETV